MGNSCQKQMAELMAPCLNQVKVYYQPQNQQEKQLLGIISKPMTIKSIKYEFCGVLENIIRQKKIHGYRKITVYDQYGNILSSKQIITGNIYKSILIELTEISAYEERQLYLSGKLWKPYIQPYYQQNKQFQSNFLNGSLLKNKLSDVGEQSDNFYSS